MSDEQENKATSRAVDLEHERLIARDPHAWEAFYERNYSAMVAYAQRRLPSIDDARDAVGDAMTRVVGGLQRMDESGASPEAWSYGVLRHVVLDYQRKMYRKREIKSEREISSPEAFERLIVSEEHDAVRAAFELLPERDREVLELRVVAGLSGDEVANVLKMKPGAVRMAQARALERLRGILESGETQ